MGKKTYLYQNRKILVTAILFFIASFTILTTVINSKAKVVDQEFNLPEGTSTIDLIVKPKVKDNNNTNVLTGVGFRVLKVKYESLPFGRGMGYYMDDFLLFNHSDDSYIYAGPANNEASSTQMKPNANGILNINKLPEGIYWLYESEMSEKGIEMIDKITIKVEKSSDESNNLKVTVSKSNDNIEVINQENSNKITIEINHHPNTTESNSNLPQYKCINQVTDGAIYSDISSLKITKEVYPPFIKDWEVNLKVGAGLFVTTNGGLENDLTGENNGGGFYSFENYNFLTGNSYHQYLEKNRPTEYAQIESDIKEKFKQYYEEYKEYCQKYPEFQFKWTSFEQYWNSYNSFSYYDENGDLQYYNIHNNYTYEQYFKKHYGQYLQEYEEYTKENLTEKYEQFRNSSYDTITLSQKSNPLEFNNTKEWNKCLNVESVNSKEMYVDIIEDDNNYEVYYSANASGLVQEGRRYYGTIPYALGHEIMITVTNWDKRYGDLQITKKLVVDNQVKTDEEFTFNITLTAPTDKQLENEYHYTINGESEQKTLSLTGEDSASKKATIKIKAGDVIRLIGLPTGTTYTVTEEVDEHKYDINAQNTNAAITGGKIDEVFFTNTKKKTGLLTVTKNVVGTNNDKDDNFNFTVTLSDKSINGEYGEMSFNNGVATFELKDTESKTAIDLPEGITYEVTESPAEGYQATYQESKGTIADGIEKQVIVTNYKLYLIPDAGGKGIANLIIFGSLLIIGSIVLLINKFSKKQNA